MKAFCILASTAAVTLAGCAFYPPVAYERVYTTPATVAVSPTYVTPPSTVVMGAGAANLNLIDSDGDGHSNAVDRFPYDATRN
jgi:hypothetical protein